MKLISHLNLMPRLRSRAPPPAHAPSWREQGRSSSVLVVRLHKAHRIMSIRSSITRLKERDGCHDPWTCFTHQIDRDIRPAVHFLRPPFITRYAPCHLVTSEGQEVKDNALRPQGLMRKSGQSLCSA